MNHPFHKQCLLFIHSTRFFSNSSSHCSNISTCYAYKSLFVTKKVQYLRIDHCLQNWKFLLDTLIAETDSLFTLSSEKYVKWGSLYDNVDLVSHVRRIVTSWCRRGRLCMWFVSLTWNVYIVLFFAKVKGFETKTKLYVKLIFL